MTLLLDVILHRREGGDVMAWEALLQKALATSLDMCRFVVFYVSLSFSFAQPTANSGPLVLLILLHTVSSHCMLARIWFSR